MGLLSTKCKLAEPRRMQQRTPSSSILESVMGQLVDESFSVRVPDHLVKVHLPYVSNDVDFPSAWCRGEHIGSGFKAQPA